MLAICSTHNEERFKKNSYGCSSFAQDKECSIDPCAAVVLKEREKRNLRQVGPEEEVQYDESTEEKRWKQARLQ
jgi:hypothetical protein